MSRPVLAMSFYSPESPNPWSPYRSMVSAATLERASQQQAKERAITGALDSLTDAVQHFFPSSCASIPARRQHSGPYQFDREYFSHLERNLQAINAQLDQLSQE